MIFESYYLVIWVAAFLTAIVSAIAGMMGGTLLLSVMAQFLKMEVLIPVHGLIQLTANASRAWYLRDSIVKAIAWESILGVVIGSVVGSFYVVRFPDHYYNIFLGAFVLLITFVPKFQTPLRFRGKWAVMGFVASFIGLFVGAVGIFVGAVFLAEKIEKKQMIATQAICQAVLHIAKVFVFMTLGFAIWPWLTLVLGALICTSLGSYVGAKILDKIPEKTFRRVVTAVIAMLAVRLIWLGITAS